MTHRILLLGEHQRCSWEAITHNTEIDRRLKYVVIIIDSYICYRKLFDWLIGRDWGRGDGFPASPPQRLLPSRCQSCPYRRNFPFSSALAPPASPPHRLTHPHYRVCHPIGSARWQDSEFFSWQTNWRWQLFAPIHKCYLLLEIKHRLEPIFVERVTQRTIRFASDKNSTPTM